MSNPHAGVAQLGAHPTCNRKVAGSSPAAGSGKRPGESRHIESVSNFVEIAIKQVGVDVKGHGGS